MTQHRAKMFDRRTFLGGGLAAIGIASTAYAMARPRTFFARHGLPIGLQLYTVAEAARNDLDGTLSKAARIGFRTIELAGFHGHEPAALRAAADRAGLRVTSIHIQAKARDSDPGLDGDLARLAADLHFLGVTDVILPIFLVPDHFPTRDASEGFGSYLARVSELFTQDDWKLTAAFLNDKGSALKREGLRLGYHNHNPEFRAVSGATGYDVIARHTDPDLVALEMDAGWVAAAGHDPAALLRRYPGRFRSMHVKDIRSSTRVNYALAQDPTEVGRGTIDWKRLLPAAYDTGIRNFFVEQEPPFERDRFDALAASFGYLDRLA